jgi:nitrite reductase/ring-hydroxylating ferredoxin subunit
MPWKTRAVREKSWQDVIAVAELMKGDATPVTLGARELAVFDTREGITVSMARCTHGAANLCDGYFDGKNIECPLHQGLFDATTGEALAAPARVKLRMLKSRVQGGQVQVYI